MKPGEAAAMLKNMQLNPDEKASIHVDTNGSILTGDSERAKKYLENAWNAVKYRKEILNGAGLRNVFVQTSRGHIGH